MSPRTLSRLGPSFMTPGRTVNRLAGNVELLEGVQVRLSVWKERGAAQRWVSLELTTGENAGLEVFVPVEALEGGEGTDLGAQLSTVLAT